MKKWLIASLTLFIVIALTSFVVRNTYPKFEWTGTTHDFGDVKLNNPVTYEFEFTNKGQAFLVISNVVASCGCTVAEYTKDPVPPNGKGMVKATYDAATPGVFNKSIAVTANVEGGPEYLYIKGVVKN
jgi:hypothetical protein